MNNSSFGWFNFTKKKTEHLGLSSKYTEYLFLEDQKRKISA